MKPIIKKISYSPSNMARRIACSGSGNLECRMPNEPSNVFAVAGTHAHALGEGALELGSQPLDDVGIWYCYTDKFTKEPAKFLVDEKTAENVQMYVDFIRSQTDGNLTNLYVEYKFKPPVNYFGVPVTAYADAMVTNAGKQTVHITDYKNGSKAVPALNNPQLAMYGLLAIEAYKRIMALPKKIESLSDFKQIELSIVQPNAFNHSDLQTWLVDDVPAFKKHWLKKFKRAIYLTKHQPNDYTVTSECTWCKGMMICPKMKELVKRFLHMAKVKQMHELTNEEISELVAAAPLVKKFLEGAEILAKERMNDGEKIPGKKLVATTRNYRNWKDEKSVIRFLKRECLTPKQFMASKLKTPAQIETVLKKLKMKDEAKQLGEHIVANPRTYMNIVDDSDAREDVNAVEGHFKDDFD